jgi:YD repeat-containing protein
MRHPAVASYDSRRRADTADLGTLIDPLGQTRTRTFDAASRLSTQTDPDKSYLRSNGGFHAEALPRRIALDTALTDTIAWRPRWTVARRGQGRR